MLPEMINDIIMLCDNLSVVNYTLFPQKLACCSPLVQIWGPSGGASYRPKGLNLIDNINIFCTCAR